MKLIERTFYLDKLKDVMGTPDIKVITGVRRSGKSKLLEAFMEYVRQTDKNANIMHVNYSLSEYEPLLEYHKLNEYVEQAYQEGKTNYIFIDEVQISCSVLTLQHCSPAEHLKLRSIRFRSPNSCNTIIFQISMQPSTVI